MARVKSTKKKWSFLCGESVQNHAGCGIVNICEPSLLLTTLTQVAELTKGRISVAVICTSIPFTLDRCIKLKYYHLCIYDT